MSEEIIDIELITKLMTDKSISAYQIEAETGLARTSIGNIRNGKSDLMKITLTKGLAVSKYAKQIYS